jgi:hypothetical protein
MREKSEATGTSLCIANGLGISFSSPIPMGEGKGEGREDCKQPPLFSPPRGRGKIMSRERR